VNVPYLSTPYVAILKLETRFPRPIGDSANPLTHAFPVRVSTVHRATVQTVVYEAGKNDVAAFVEAAQQEIAKGAIAIGTSCGFLFEHQALIQAQIPAPFISSALTVLATLNDNDFPVGVLTFDDEVLLNAQWMQKAPFMVAQGVVQGLPKQGHLYRTIRHDGETLDERLARQETIDCALRLAQKIVIQTAQPPKTIVFECTNLGPYKEAVRSALSTAGFAPNLIDYNDVLARCWQGLSARLSV
jgi:hypothetical protein